MPTTGTDISSTTSGSKPNFNVNSECHSSPTIKTTTTIDRPPPVATTTNPLPATEFVAYWGKKRSEKKESLLADELLTLCDSQLGGSAGVDGVGEGMSDAAVRRMHEVVGQLEERGRGDVGGCMEGRGLAGGWRLAFTTCAVCTRVLIRTGTQTVTDHFPVKHLLRYSVHFTLCCRDVLTELRSFIFYFIFWMLKSTSLTSLTYIFMFSPLPVPTRELSGSEVCERLSPPIKEITPRPGEPPVPFRCEVLVRPYSCGGGGRGLSDLSPARDGSQTRPSSRAGVTHFLRGWAQARSMTCEKTGRRYVSLRQQVAPRTITYATTYQQKNDLYSRAGEYSGSGRGVGLESRSSNYRNFECEKVTAMYEKLPPAVFCALGQVARGGKGLEKLVAQEVTYVGPKLRVGRSREGDMFVYERCTCAWPEGK